MFFELFFLLWIWEESTNVSRTGAKCWAGSFPQEVQQTCTSSLTVCLRGSSKRFCWRKSPFAWLVWSKLGGFVPAGLLEVVYIFYIQKLGVASIIALSNYKIKIKLLRLSYSEDLRPVNAALVSTDSREAYFLVLQPYSKIDLILFLAWNTVSHHDKGKRVCLKSLQMY